MKAKTIYTLTSIILVISVIAFLYLRSEQKSSENLDKITKEWDEKFRKDSIRSILDSIDRANSPDRLVVIKQTEAVEKSIKSFKKKKDEFKGVTFYNNYEPYGYANYVKIYLVNLGGKINGRFEVGYTNNDWLFVKNYQFLCDGKRYEYTPRKIERDNSGGSVFEYSDDPYTKAIKDIVEAIVSSKNVTMRYNGDQFYHDRKISDKEKLRLKEMYNILQ